MYAQSRISSNAATTMRSEKVDLDLSGGEGGVGPRSSSGLSRVENVGDSASLLSFVGHGHSPGSGRPGAGR